MSSAACLGLSQGGSLCLGLDFMVIYSFAYVAFHVAVEVCSMFQADSVDRKGLNRCGQRMAAAIRVKPDSVPGVAKYFVQ